VTDLTVDIVTFRYEYQNMITSNKTISILAIRVNAGVITVSR